MFAHICQNSHTTSRLGLEYRCTWHWKELPGLAPKLNENACFEFEPYFSQITAVNKPSAFQYVRQLNWPVAMFVAFAHCTMLYMPCHVYICCTLSTPLPPIPLDQSFFCPPEAVADHLAVSPRSALALVRTPCRQLCQHRHTLQVLWPWPIHGLI